MIDGDRYPFSRRIRTLRGILAKLEPRKPSDGQGLGQRQAMLLYIDRMVSNDAAGYALVKAEQERAN